MTQPQTEAVAAPAPEPAPPAPLPSPGTLLRQARERAGLGAEDLAGQLKLAKGTLEALERDDFAALSEPVYVRGYYRKIAKVLPVAEADLIGAYNARTKPAPSAAPLRRLPLAGGVAAGSSRHARGPGVGLVLTGLVALVILIAFATREPAPRLAERAPAASMSAPAAVSTPASAEPAATQAGAADAAAAAAVSVAPAEGATSGAPVAAASGVPNQLVLEFSEASFVRVEDGRAKTLAIGLVRGGERHALDGQPPYTVFLGNANNVKVFFSGQPVDFSAHINRQNDTARFTVP